jgi:GTP-binding protein YchF
MNVTIGIVGLPNVGKSTLFNALTQSNKAAAENFPFCTIDPNTGIVEVPDDRIDKLAEIVEPQKIIRSAIEFVDIAGLVEGASKGEGLGNKFLSHIRECHAIAHVLRAFDSSDIHHVSGKVDPSEDFGVILTELILADLESIDRQIERLSRKSRAGNKEAQADQSLLEKFKIVLEAGQLAITAFDDLTEDEQKGAQHLQLLTTKKFMIIANTAEDNYASFDADAFREKVKPGMCSDELWATIPVVPVCAKLEADLVGMDKEEVTIFLDEIGAKQSGLQNLAQAGFNLLGLQQYFTAGVQEVRSWTIPSGARAPQAAGAIHTDFEKGFIKADTIAYQDFVDFNGEAGAKENGKMRMEGKEYIVKDGDVMHFKFNN